MRVKVEPKQAYHLINHGPCNLITTGDGARRNVAPINWTMPINNDPALMGTVIEEKIFTNELILKSGQFTINLMSEPHAQSVLSCGRSHGRDLDKFEKFGFTPVKGILVQAPFLKESLAHIECEVMDQRPYEGVILYVGKVLHAEAEQDVWDGKSLIIEKAKSIHHLTGGTFAVSERAVIVQKPKI